MKKKIDFSKLLLFPLRQFSQLSLPQERIKQYESSLLENLHAITHENQPITLRQISELSRTLSIHQITDNNVKAKYLSLIKKNINDFDLVDIRKSRSALLKNKIICEETFSALSKRENQILGLSDHQHSLKFEENLPSTTKFFLRLYNFRWRFLKRFEKYGINFK